MFGGLPPNPCGQRRSKMSKCPRAPQGFFQSAPVKVLCGGLMAALCLSTAVAGGHTGAGKPHMAAPPAVAASATATAPLTVEGAWVRATVKGQAATGGFMTLRADRDLSLVGFRSAAAPQAELHEMKMDGDVMRMRAIERLPLPAGKAVALRPGGHHLMLMGLTQPLSAGQTIKLELLLQDAQGASVVQSVMVPVRSTAPAGAAREPAGGHHHHH